MDPVIGVDLHIVMVPSPAGPVPTPVPMPFVGLVFDPVGLAVGTAIGCAMGAGTGLVFVNGLPATNCGTEVTNKLTSPHLPAPGVAFAKGIVGNDAMLNFGGHKVSFGGAYAVRLGDIAMSCSDPVRLPTSVVLAIPKGAPVLVLRPMVPDLTTIAMGLAFQAAFRVLGRALRAGAAVFRAARQMQRNSRFWRGASRRMRSSGPGRARSRWNRAVCFLTGHPVDVVTGRVLTGDVDFALPGPFPLRFKRNYDSSLSWRSGPLGYGWSHSLDESITVERHAVVYRDEEGREVEFDTLDLPDQQLATGQTLYDPVNQITLKSLGKGRWIVEMHNGSRHTFEPLGPELQSVEAKQNGVSRILRRESREGHSVEFSYDARGRLVAVYDACQRRVDFSYDAEGRLTEIRLPDPGGQGTLRRRFYQYDRSGDLVAVEDALGHAWRFAYQNHLLVQESDRVNFSFYFAYDGLSADAKCVRTWGDGGVLDHLIRYDVASRKSYVENSLGNTTVYEFDDAGQVIAIVDPLGSTRRYVYDDAGRPLCIENGAGEKRNYTYDEHGNLSETEQGGFRIRTEYGTFGRPTRRIDANGNEWSWTYDSFGRQREATDPLGRVRTLEWKNGRPLRKKDFGGLCTEFSYDSQGNLLRRTTAGTPVCKEYDALGRQTAEVTPSGARIERDYDLEGRVVEERGTFGTVRFHYDAQGNLKGVEEAERTISVHYEGHHWPAGTSIGGKRILRLEHNAEGFLQTVRNAAGQAYRYDFDAAGRVVGESNYGGARRSYELDGAGRLSKLICPSGRTKEYAYDALGRVESVAYDDGTCVKHRYRPDGFLEEVDDGEQKVTLKRDALGRLLEDAHGDGWVRSVYSGEKKLGFKSSKGVRCGYLPKGIAYQRGKKSWAARLIREAERRGVVFPGGASAVSELDGLRRPTRRMMRYRAGADGEMQWDETQYAWKGWYEQQSQTEVGTGRQTRYFHDALGRLEGIRYPEGEEEQRPLDLAENLLGDSPRSYGASGELQRLGEERRAYDEDGRLVERETPQGTFSYRYDARDRLVEVERPDGESVRFGYDPLGRRLYKESKGIRSDFLWHGRALLHETSRKESQGAKPKLLTWLCEPDSLVPLACVDDKGCSLSIVSELNGLPSAVLGPHGELLAKPRFDSRGNLLEAAKVGTATRSKTLNFNGIHIPFRFRGQQIDRETGLFYNGFRYYDPIGGSYITPDPLRLKGGLNLYHYPLNPLVFTDPLGLDDCFRADARDWDALHADGGFRPRAPENASNLGDMDSFVRDGAPDGYSVSTTRDPVSADLSNINDPGAGYMYIIDMDHPSMADRHLHNVADSSNPHAHEIETVVRHPDWADAQARGADLSDQPAIPIEAIIGRVERDGNTLHGYDGPDAQTRDLPGGGTIDFEPRPPPPDQPRIPDSQEVNDFYSQHPEFAQDPDAHLFDSDSVDYGHSVDDVDPDDFY